MQTITQVKYLRAAVNAEKDKGQAIALVPTMGHLHEGHLQLVRRAHEIAEVVIVSLFVNPMQFGEGEDFDTYPRTLAEDQEKLEAENVHYLFMPEDAEMYPNGTADHTSVAVKEMGSILCGVSRPVFFEGVCTVVCKLFNLVQPTCAVFGEKDFQQLAIIKRMVSDLCMPIDIVGVPTARAHDGLALSSRNSYLNTVDRARAPALYENLKQTRDEIAGGNHNYTQLIQQARDKLSKSGFDVDYFEIRQSSNLAEASQPSDAELVILAAANLGKTRLIDNIVV